MMDINTLITIFVAVVIICVVAKVAQAVLRAVLLGVVVIFLIVAFPNIKDIPIIDSIMNHTEKVFTYEENGETKTIPVGDVSSVEIVDTDIGKALKIIIKQDDGTEKVVINPISNSFSSEDIETMKQGLIDKGINLLQGLNK